MFNFFQHLNGELHHYDREFKRILQDRTNEEDALNVIYAKQVSCKHRTNNNKNCSICLEELQHHKRNSILTDESRTESTKEDVTVTSERTNESPLTNKQTCFHCNCISRELKNKATCPTCKCQINDKKIISKLKGFCGRVTQQRVVYKMNVLHNVRVIPKKCLFYINLKP